MESVNIVENIQLGESASLRWNWNLAFSTTNASSLERSISIFIDPTFNTNFVNTFA